MITILHIVSDYRHIILPVVLLLTVAVVIAQIRSLWKSAREDWR